MTDPKETGGRDEADGDVADVTTEHETLSGFNAAQIVDDPDDLDRDPPQPPAATPDSPNPI